MSDLAAVLARLDKITPGDWYFDPGEEDTFDGIAVRSERKPANVVPIFNVPVDYDDRLEREANAFAATLLPELIAVAKAAAELREEMPNLVAFVGTKEWGDLYDRLADKMDAALSALAKKGGGMKPTKQAKPERMWAVWLPPPVGLLPGTWLTKADAIAKNPGFAKFINRVEIRVLGGKK